MEKALQLHQIQELCHGVMMVGPSGSGKTTTWRLLLDAMEAVDSVKGDAHVIDPKALSKEELYGVLDGTTLEWTDGVFTGVLRQVLNNVRGEASRRQWIIFDGDVDPEWAENLNSVLDDNRLLTLPSGERLSIPPNVRIMFEVESLKYVTSVLLWCGVTCRPFRTTNIESSPSFLCCPCCIDCGRVAVVVVVRRGVWCGVVWCGVVWCGVVWCGVMQVCDTRHCVALWHGVVQ